MTEHEETMWAVEEPHAVSDAPPDGSPPSRRRRVLVVVSVVAVLIAAAGLVSACRNQPLSQAYRGRFGSYVTP
jgi:hypothetical protein